MTNNPFGIKPIKIKPINIYGNSQTSSGRKPISKGLREKVWIKYMKNKVQGKCYCCRIKPIHFTDFEVGHDKSVYAGGSNHINNLRPICRSCNREMGTKSIEWWRKKYYAEPTSKPKSVSKKPTRKKSSGQTWINPLTGRKEKFNPFGI